MATGHQHDAPKSRRVGEHWSGANPIPTISHFMKHVEDEKKERNLRIDEEHRANKERIAHEKAQGTYGEQSEHADQKDQAEGGAVAHKPREVSQARIRTVTDPTTGKEIGVEDLDETCMDTVNNPMVCGIISKES